MATSPGSQSMGTAPGKRSEPLAARIALMSALPPVWVPGTTHRAFSGVVGYRFTMKLKPCVPASSAGLCQCVVPS